MQLGNRVYELEEALAQRDEHIDKLEGELEGLEGQAGINQAVVEKLKQVSSDLLFVSVLR